jgi:DUF1365 family protein
MSHRFLEGSVYHKRFVPKVHEFTYPFFLLDIDVSKLHRLKNRLFSLGGWNLFSFFPKDHFGSSEDFYKNIESLLADFDLQPTKDMRFLTLPRIFNYVFNPISVLMLFDEGKPTSMLVEVHNYNGGRIVYFVSLKHQVENRYNGVVDRYVCLAFFKTRWPIRFCCNAK